MATYTQRVRPRRLPLLAASALVFSAMLSCPVAAQTGRFDLLGPSVDVHVTRGDRSLPIANVPNLQPGDKLQVHADLPQTQSVKLLLVVAFLRGTTNPPPEKWFTRIETWDKRVRDEGVTVTVPEGAEQALIFIAPETGGDFSTLKSAVRGRPGTFVRASQDLNEASFEQSRIERYAAAIKQVPAGSPAELLDHSHKLAATLQLKTNEDCFKRAPDLQATCLSQSGSALLLDDGHGQTMAQTLSTGATSDLIGAVAGTPVATAGGVAAYSAYVGTVLDVVRLLTGLHTAKYQYIPAIAFPEVDALNLRLNTAPSFNNPKSVIVIALPAIQKAVPPPLQLQDARHVSCLLQPQMVLPLNGAPLVFATGFAHDLTLHLDRPAPDGRTDLPLVPDAYDGGLMVSDREERKPLGTTAEAANAPVAAKAMPATPQQKASEGSAPTSPPAVVADAGALQGTGVVRGFWGFDAFEGPKLTLQRRPGEGWTARSAGELFTGRSNTVDLHSSGTACVAGVDLASGTPQPLQWHIDEGGPGPAISVKLPLEKSSPGDLKLLVRQYAGSGHKESEQAVALTAYADAVKGDEVVLHAGDRSILLRGSGLGSVKAVLLRGAKLVPGDLAEDAKTLKLEPAPASTAEVPPFKAGERGAAEVLLADGRSISVPLHVEAARPALSLLSSTVQPPAAQGLPIALGDARDLPLEGKLTLALRSELPMKFPRNEKVEVALVDGTLTTTLSLQDRTLVLQDARTVLGFVTPSTVFGPSAFGALQLRALSADGTVSDWLPLGTLVRTPVVRQVVCGPRAGTGVHPLAAAPPGNAEALEPGAGTDTPQPVLTPCTLEGSNLFLVQSVSGSAGFTNALEVAPGYGGDSLQVPRPSDGHTLYLRLRDDPTHIASLVLDAGRLLKK